MAESPANQSTEEGAPASAPLPLRPSRTMRWLYFGLGWVFFAVGILGFLLPVLPGVVFMLLALWCFARSSERFHQWLLHHPRFGPPLQRWVAHRVVPLWVKLVAWGSMIASTSYLFWRGDVPWPVLAGMVTLVAIAIWYLARCPSKPPG